jgi:hypothetical protein
MFKIIKKQKSGFPQMKGTSGFSMPFFDLISLAENKHLFFFEAYFPLTSLLSRFLPLQLDLARNRIADKKSRGRRIAIHRKRIKGSIRDDQIFDAVDVTAPIDDTAVMERSHAKKALLMVLMCKIVFDKLLQLSVVFNDFASG